MSKETDAKREVQEILNKSQKALLERIQNFRIQIKEVRERELSKALIPVHDHKPGTTVGAGTEDVPYGKINPKGINKNLEADAGAGNNLAMSKGALCKDCGHMHLPTEPHYEKKSELVDEKGNLESNSVKTPYKDGAKSPEVKGDKGGIVLPGKKLKKALSAGGGGGAPSTKVNGDALTKESVDAKDSRLMAESRTKRGNVDMKGKHVGDKWYPEGHSKGPAKKPVSLIVQPDAEHKSEPPMAKPPSGKNMGTAVPTSTAKSELAKGLFTDAAKQADPVSASHAAAKPAAGVKLPGAHLQSQRAASFGAAMGGEFQPKGPINSGLELAGGPKKPGLGLSSPAAAGAAPQAGFKPPAIKPVSPAAPQAPSAGNKLPSVAPVGMSAVKPMAPAVSRASGALGLSSPVSKPAAMAAPIAKPQAPAAPAQKPGIFGKIGGFRKP